MVVLIFFPGSDTLPLPSTFSLYSGSLFSWDTSFLGGWDDDSLKHAKLVRNFRLGQPNPFTGFPQIKSKSNWLAEPQACFKNRYNK